MSKLYTCDQCFRSYSKLEYNKHKKISCLTDADNKTILISIFKSCLNILRDNEALTGDKALRSLSYLLILKLIEPRLNDTIDINNYDFDFSAYEDNYIDKLKEKLLVMIRFSNLVKEDENNITNIMRHLWDDILSVHPSTKNIFLKNKYFDIQYQSTYKRLIDKLNTLPSTEYDILGNAYEEVIQDIMTGKVLGQYFTQPLVKKIMVKLISPKIYSDGKIETCCDPTMGTGGFLITYLKYIIKKAEKNNIELDWDFIKTEGLYGKEVEPDTYQLAVSNMLISSGHMFEQLERGDSIREPITRKFDNILANPPFGIKGLKYDSFSSSLKFEYTPIKTDNAVSLFIQAIIYMLKINGKCAVVLPDGQDLFSKTNNTLVIIREYLMKTCDLKEIIYLPSGIFTYTSIKTCLFYFIKKKEGKDILETKINVSKTQKETGREYKFSKTHQTHTVKFYETKISNDTLDKNLLIEVDIETIANNSYSLNYTEYIKNETEKYNEEIEIKTLGEICEFQNGYAFKSSDYQEKNNINIGILQIKSIQNGYIDENKITEYIEENKKYKLFEIHKGDILIGLTGTFKIGIYNLDYKSYLNQRVGKIIAKTNIIQKYIYYWYLCYDIENEILKIAKGTAQANISTNDISNLKIPLPSLEKQNYIVKYLDFIYEKANKTSNDKITELKELNEFIINNQINYGKNEEKTLGEICNFDIGGTPNRNREEYYINGTNLWVSVKELNGGYIFDTKEKITDLGVKNSSVKLFKKDTILFSFKLSIGKTAIVGNPLYTNEAIAGIFSKNNNLLDNRYIYYYLTINDFSMLGSGIIGNGSLNKKSLEQIKIPLPSLEKQKEIIKLLEFNDNLIKQLELEIENNKELAKSFISNITELKESNEIEIKDELTKEIITDSSNSELFEESVKVKKSKK